MNIDTRFSEDVRIHVLKSQGQQSKANDTNDEIANPVCNYSCQTYGGSGTGSTIWRGCSGRSRPPSTATLLIAGSVDDKIVPAI
jgi:hypothetical protein